MQSRRRMRNAEGGEGVSPQGVGPAGLFRRLVLERGVPGWGGEEVVAVEARTGVTEDNRQWRRVGGGRKRPRG